MKLENLEGKTNAIVFLDKDKIVKKKFVRVDEWEPESCDDIYINFMPGSCIAPLTAIGLSANIMIDDSKDFNRFIISTKKGYNSVEMRGHMFRYLNYFLNFYDQDMEYLMILFKLKINIDRYDSHQYPKESFYNDLERYILYGGLKEKVEHMVEDNYYQNINYKILKDPVLQYSNDDVKILHKISMMVLLSIPLLTQYAYMHKVSNIEDYLLGYYDRVLQIDPSVNMGVKLYETAFSRVINSEKSDATLWAYQPIRGQNTISHAQDSLNNIIINIIPKYVFNDIPITLNFASVGSSIKFKVTDIQYEFQFAASSSSKRDNDSVSDFDRFESALIKQNEALYLQNKINSDIVMKNIENTFGPFHKEEIDFYTKELLYDANGQLIINKFQKQLVFLLFYKYFKDTQSIYNINRMEYIELILTAKKILKAANMRLMPCIISSRVDKLVQRKNINKKERLLIEASPQYPMILNKYKNEDIIDNIFSIIATILSSDFTIIDTDPTINGIKLDVSSTVGILIEEVCSFILLC